MRFFIALVIPLLVACNNEPTPTTDQPADAPAWTTDAERDQVVEARARQALEQIRELAADQIISDEVVRAAVRGAVGAHWSDYGPARDVSYHARRQVFSEHQCWIFAGYPTGDTMFHWDACSTARYYEGMVEENVGYEKAGIPVSIAPIIAEMRATIYATGRAHLADPDNLRAVYTAKKPVVLDEYLQLRFEDRRGEFRTAVANSLEAFILFRDNGEARTLYGHYISLNPGRYDDPDVKQAWLNTKEAFEQAVPGDRYSFMFAGRRYVEGNAELVDAYIDVLADLQASLEAIPPLPDDS